MRSFFLSSEARMGEFVEFLGHKERAHMRNASDIRAFRCERSPPPPPPPPPGLPHCSHSPPRCFCCSTAGERHSQDAGCTC